MEQLCRNAVTFYYASTRSLTRLIERAAGHSQRSMQYHRVSHMCYYYLLRDIIFASKIKPFCTFPLPSLHPIYHTAICRTLRILHILLYALSPSENICFSLAVSARFCQAHPSRSIKISPNLLLPGLCAIRSNTIPSTHPNFDDSSYRAAQFFPQRTLSESN